MQREDWLLQQTRRPHGDQARALAERVRRENLRLAVVLPAKDDARTLGKHLLALRHGWPGETSPWCEVAVVDFGSIDATSEIARAQDARLLGGIERFLPGDVPAEGLALRRAVDQLGCDLVTVVPAGLRRIDWDLLSGLSLALLERPHASLCLGYQDVPPPSSSLSLRPLLAAIEPDLSLLPDPTCPVLAVRSAHIRSLPIAATIGYEPALTMDVWKLRGLESICQAPVGSLLWQDGSRRHGEEATFRSVLALLEASQRLGILSHSGSFEHLYPGLSEDPSGFHVHSTLQLFRWSSPSPEVPRLD